MERTIPIVELDLVGPLRVRVAEDALTFTSAKQRELLRRLGMAEPAEVVTAEQLIDALWGESPPATAAKNLQVLIGRVRRALDDVGADGSATLRTVPGGYRLDPEWCTTDLARLRAATSTARRALDRGHGAAATAALATQVATVLRLEPGGVRQLAACRDAAEVWSRAQLASGGTPGAAREVLAHLVEVDPFHEPTVVRLALVLLLSGAEEGAISVTAAARARLELVGIEPGEELDAIDADPHGFLVEWLAARDVVTASGLVPAPEAEEVRAAIVACLHGDSDRSTVADVLASHGCAAFDEVQVLDVLDELVADGRVQRQVGPGGVVVLRLVDS